MKDGDPYKEHVISIVFVVLAALSIGSLDNYLNNYNEICYLAILLFLIGTLYIIIVNKELLFEYINGRYLNGEAGTYDYSSKKLKFNLFLAIDTLLMFFCMVVILNLHPIDTIIYNLVANYILLLSGSSLILGHAFKNIDLIRWGSYLPIFLVIFMVETLPLRKELQSYALRSNLVVKFRPETIDIISGECVEVSLFMRNMGTEKVIINKITVEFPPEIEVYECDGDHIVELNNKIELPPKKRWGIRYNIEYNPDKNAPFIKHSHAIINVELEGGHIIEKVVKLIMYNN
jgi:hypothetical protein